MKLTGTRRFDATRPVVWAVLNDPAEMAALMPGVESFEIDDASNWRTRVAVPVGLGTIKLEMGFQKLEERALEYSSLRAKGKGVGALISMETRFTLVDDADGTNMDWEADVTVGGPVGGMGQRVIQPIVNQQVTHVLNALDARIKAASQREAPNAEYMEE